MLTSPASPTAPYQSRPHLPADLATSALPLHRIKQLQAQGCLPTDNVKVLVAGLAHSTSQKLHNLIHAIERVDRHAELVLMLDDDMRMVRASHCIHRH
jgi:hypothetical protein